MFIIKRTKRFIFHVLQLLYYFLLVREFRISGIEKGEFRGKKAMVMGNGPSLRLLLEKYHSGSIEIPHDSFFVNFAPLDDSFFEIKPMHFLLSDYGFSREGKDNPQIKLMYERLQNKVDWNLKIYIARYSKEDCQQLVEYSKITNPHINFVFLYKRYCDDLKVSWRNWLYKTGFFMPVESTVISTAIWTAILEGYSEIELYGVDTNQFKDLSVDENNFVYIDDKHFYGNKLSSRVIGDENGEPIKIHVFLGTIAGMLKSHYILSQFAEYMGAKIYNCSPGSMIDVYPRKKTI